LKFLVASSISRFELEHLKKLETKTDFTIDRDYYADDFRRDLRHMRSLGLIDNYPNKGIRALYVEPGQYKNIHDFFYITEAGKTYLRLRADIPGKEPRAR
jgi:hypothetical protein